MLQGRGMLEGAGRREGGGVGGGDTGEGRYSRMKTFRARTEREKRMLIYRDAMMPRVQQKDISLLQACYRYVHSGILGVLYYARKLKRDKEVNTTRARSLSFSFFLSPPPLSLSLSLSVCGRT